jgi:AcrR family transcriptional regulator
LEKEVTEQTHTRILKRGTAEVILKAAERLCGLHGIEAVSIRDIAAEAGVSIAVIYHHYKSKDNLLLAILRTRFEEIGKEYGQLMSELEAQSSPSVGSIVRAVLQPINRWRRPGREAALQFYALALVCPMPQLREAIDRGVVGLHRVTDLLQRALPRLSHEDICWRLHFTMKISHQTQWDAVRLNIMSKGKCNFGDPDEALERSIAFAEAAFLAPPFEGARKSTKRGRSRSRRG